MLSIVDMRIRKPRYLTTGQIALVTILGVFGGVYIWKPLILKYRFDNVTKPTNVENKQNGNILDN